MKFAPLSDELAWAAREAWFACNRSRKLAAEKLGIHEDTLDNRLQIAKERWGLPIPEKLRRAKTPDPAPLKKPKYRFTADGTLVGIDGQPTTYREQPWAQTDRDNRYDGQQGDAPPGMTMRGVSTLTDAEGNIRQEWSKTKVQCRPVEESVQLANARITSVSTLYDAQGMVAQQWVKENTNEENQKELIKHAIGQYLMDYPKIPIIEPPNKFDTDIIPWFQIGDAHLGLLAHEAETGANFDLKIAERELCQAFSILFDECPYRERCVINDLGDGTHTENMLAVTEASRHPLDVDGRFPRMIGVYVRTMRFIIDRALEKFKVVDVIVNQGNHSRTNDIFMAELLRQVYAHTDRVNVLDNSSVYIPYRQGNTFILVHHSDKTKPARLAQVMANDFRQDWGETEYHYIDVGHLHHKWTAHESAGCTIEMWNTLAAKDKWTHDSGYRSHQSITRVDRSKTYGEVGRRVLPIKEIRNVIIKAYGDEAYIPPERRRVFVA